VTSREAGVDTVCPNCGEIVAPSDTFCEACGAQLGAAPAPAPDPERTDAGTERGTHFLDPPRAAATESIPLAPSPSEPVEVRHCSCGGVIDPDGWCTICGLRAPNERDHLVERPAANIAAVCDRGVAHSRNEDAVALAATASRVVLVVCDGVTSATDSDVASLAAARAARDALAAAPVDSAAGLDARIERWQHALNAATAEAQAAAVAAAHAVGADENPPSCTFVASVLDGLLLTVAWVGDSRAYWFGDDGVATQCSTDDSWASGEISHGVPRTVAEADVRAHAITRWLGVDSPGGDPGFTSMTVTSPGWVLVCSDGLWNYCSEPTDLRDLLRDKAAAVGDDPLALAEALVAWANEQGGHDNITAALARASGAQAPANPEGA
jgi:serine/threonine protein phosphatase PrpC